MGVERPFKVLKGDIMVVSCWLLVGPRNGRVRAGTLKPVVRQISQARLRPANRRALSSKLDARQFAARNAVPCGHFASLVRSPATRSARLPFESSLRSSSSAHRRVTPNDRTRNAAFAASRNFTKMQQRAERKTTGKESARCEE